MQQAFRKHTSVSRAWLQSTSETQQYHSVTRLIFWYLKTPLLDGKECYGKVGSTTLKNAPTRATTACLRRKKRRHSRINTQKNCKWWSCHLPESTTQSTSAGLDNTSSMACFAILTSGSSQAPCSNLRRFGLDGAGEPRAEAARGAAEGIVLPTERALFLRVLVVLESWALRRVLRSFV